MEIETIPSRAQRSELPQDFGTVPGAPQDQSCGSWSEAGWAFGTSRRTFEIIVRLTEEEDGVFSCHAANLPGVVSQGRTLEEAIDRIGEAAAAVIAEYRDQKQVVPWDSNPASAEAGETTRWIVVHV